MATSTWSNIANAFKKTGLGKVVNANVNVAKTIGKAAVKNYGNANTRNASATVATPASASPNATTATPAAQGTSTTDALLANYSKMYNDAKAKGDWMSMEYANKMANQLRGQGAVVTATADINAVKSANQQTPNSGFSNPFADAGSTQQQDGQSWMDKLGDAFGKVVSASGAAAPQAQEAAVPVPDETGKIYMINPANGKVIHVSPQNAAPWLEKGFQYYTEEQSQMIDPNASVQDNVYNSANQLGASSEDANAQLQKIIKSLSSLTSSNNYQTILEKILAQNMPTYNSGAAELSDQYADNAKNIDIDAERRGLYNSGVAGSLQQENNADKAAALAKLLADIRALSTNQASTAVSQQIQAAGLQGDLVTKGAELSQSGIKAALDALLGSGNLAVNQQNANTNAQQTANNYNINLLQLGIDQSKLDESARQFDARLDLDKTLRADDVEQFAQSMGLNWAQLSASSKAQAADSMYRAQELALATKKFESEEDLIKRQQAQDNLQILFGAYDMLDKMFAQGATKVDAVASVAPYKSGYPEVYTDLLNTINNQYRTTAQ